MICLVLEELVLLLALLLIYITMGSASLIDRLNLALQLDNVARLLLLFGL